MTQHRIEPTTRQREYVVALQRKLHLSDAALDMHSRRTFDAPYAELERGQVTQLINQLLAWERVPAELQRAMGPQDLFEVSA